MATDKEKATAAGHEPLRAVLERPGTARHVFLTKEIHPKPLVRFAQKYPKSVDSVIQALGERLKVLLKNVIERGTQLEAAGSMVYEKCWMRPDGSVCCQTCIRNPDGSEACGPITCTGPRGGGDVPLQDLKGVPADWNITDPLPPTP